MKRIHAAVSQASELVFVDSTGTVDRDGHKVFQILTYNEVGGLPLGILITGSETTKDLVTATEMLRDLVGEDAFYKRAERGPDIFMTDDCDAEKNALSTVWPESIVLLCTFHVLQAVWRWVLNAKSGIPAKDRRALFYLFKNLVYADSVDDCLNLYDKLQTDPIAKIHPKYQKHIHQLWERRQDWALCYRREDNLLLRGNNTNNYVEAAMRILKDQVLHRVKAFNIVQLVEFVTTRLDAHYRRKLLNGANNRTTKRKTRVYNLPATNVAQQIVQLSECQFSVPSEKTEGLCYNVDTAMKFCTCTVGATGASCKHQFWVEQLTGELRPNIHSVSVRAMCYLLATGKTADPEWLRPLHDGPSCSSHSDTSEPPTPTPATAPCIRLVPDLSDVVEQVNETTQNCDSTLQPNLSGLETIERISALLTSFYTDAPEVIGPALLRAEENLRGATTTAARASALFTLGNGNVRVRKGSRIPVQPTALARRRTALSGRRGNAGGRPRSSNPAQPAKQSREHGEPPQKRKAPHNLAYCVDKNIRLGSTHSKK
jgi:MULE transposase domain